MSRRSELVAAKRRYLVTWSDDQMDHTELLELTDEERDKVERWLNSGTDCWDSQIVALDDKPWWADFSDFRMTHMDEEDEEE